MLIDDDSCEKLLNVGDEMYRIGKNNIEKITIVSTVSYPHWVYKDNKRRTYFNRAIGHTLFKTKEEAEKEFHRRSCITEKRKLLRKYETELNEKFNLIDHFIVS